MAERTDQLSDRERLAAAFDELRSRGYAAPIEFAWEMCCSSCGCAELDRRGCDDRYVFWNVQMDDASFYGDHAVPLPEPMRDALRSDGVPEDDDEAIDAWMEAHAEQVNALFMVDRLAHGTLLNPLFLQWGGDKHLICSVLANHGLKAVKPATRHKTIEVRSVGQGL
ncbi:MAG: hypothetical protein V4472_25500 [Pseudomonadota bacterium]